MPRRPFDAAALTVAVLLASCGGAGAGGSADDDGRLRVVTTVSPITSIVAAVAGDAAEVEGIVPEGENSHEFSPRPRVARLLADADIVFVNGLALEEPTIRLAKANLDDDARLVELGPSAVDRHEWVFDVSFPETEGNPNPHVWTSPAHGRRYAAAVRDALVASDPHHAGTFRSNHRRLDARLRHLDAAVRQATATVPPHRRKLLTYHDSFPYFAKEYGWTVIGAIQPSDFSEPSPRDVADLIRQIESENVPAVFGSEVFPSPVLRQIGRETGVRYIDTLRDDDLPGRPGDDDHTYVGLLVADFVTMVEALGGDASALEDVPVTATVPDRARYPQ